MFHSVFAFVIVQRIVELIYARRNERVMRAQGAYEVGAGHYPWMLLLHVSFFVSLFVEASRDVFSMPLLVVFLLLQVARVWCIRALGVFWNTKILILPGGARIASGPYRFLRHPNYVVVSLEIAVLPLMFEAYVTALLFTLLNFAMLAVRISVEERALRELDR